MSDLVIRTPRLILRAMSAGDAHIVADYYKRNRAHLAPWEPERSEDFYREDLWTDRLEKAHAAYMTGTAVNFVLVDPDSGQMTGSCNFSNILYGVFQACHLGYSIDAGHEGRGLMFEAVSAGIDHMFRTVGLHRIMANHLPENHRSAALLRRLGFEREGYARAYLKIAGRWQDHVLNALINPADL